MWRKHPEDRKKENKRTEDQENRKTQAAKVTTTLGVYEVQVKMKNRQQHYECQNLEKYQDEWRRLGVRDRT